MGQAAPDQRGRRLAHDRATVEFPGPYSVAHPTADAPAHAAPQADSVRDAVPAADGHAAPDGHVAPDEPAHYRTADPDAYPVSANVGHALARGGARRSERAEQVPDGRSGGVDGEPRREQLPKLAIRVRRNVASPCRESKVNAPAATTTTTISGSRAGEPSGRHGEAG